MTLTNSDIVSGVSSLVSSSSPAGIAPFTPVNVTGKTLGTGPGQVWVNSIQIETSQTFGFAEVPMPIPLLSSANGYEPGPIATETQFDRDIVLGLNRSGSMNEYSTDVASWSPGGPGQSYYSSRWRELTSAVAVFNSFLSLTPQNENIPLAKFSKTSGQDVALTYNTAQLQTTLDDITNKLRYRPVTSDVVFRWLSARLCCPSSC